MSTVVTENKSESSGRNNSAFHVRLLTCLMILIGLTSCEPKNEPPTAILEVTPMSLEVPAEIRMQVTGEDPNGVEDITQYILMIGNETVKSKIPIDITRTFHNVGTIKIYGQVTDSENQINKTEVQSLELVLGPYIEQIATLINDNEISYLATVYKKTGAQLEIKKDGASFLTLSIPDVNSSGVDYQKIFKFSPDGITKGDYECVLKADNLEKKNSVSVPNYKPTANFTGLELDMEQDGNISLTLGGINDKNPEDVVYASYTDAKSMDGKTSTSLSGNDLKINALPNQTGDYRVEVEYGSTTGGLEKSVLTGNITPHTWMYLVNPFVQPNDTTKAIVWNNFSTPSQRNAHFNDRLYNYDKTDEIENPDWVCSDYVRAWKIAFNGYPMEGLENNNWHNIPAYDVTLRIFNKPSHALGGVIMGDYVSDIANWRFVETQNDSTFSPNQIKEWGTYEIEVYYTRVIVDQIQGEILDNLPILKFVLNDSGDWIDSGYRHPDINLIEQRKK